MAIKVSVIIPVFNCWKLTSSCLKALARVASGISLEQLEVIVVDNASADLTATECPLLGQRLFGTGFKYLQQNTNRNFAPACNIGAQAASGEFLFFLNNDTVVTEGWLTPLLNAFTTTPKLGSCGPLLLYPELFGFKNRVQHAGICFGPQYYPLHIFEAFPSTHAAVKKAHTYQALTAAALLVPRALFLESGLFDEDFINGGEDIEFGLRLTQKGYTNTFVAGSLIYHLCGQTLGRHIHEEHNGKMLKQKALHYIVPNMHLAAHNAGYIIALDTFATPYLTLPQRRLELAERAMPKGDIHALNAFVEHEPLLFNAYNTLAALYEKEGELTLACNTLALSLKLRQDIATAQELIRIAANAGLTQNYPAAVNLLNTLENGINFNTLHNKCLAMRDFWLKVEQEPPVTSGNVQLLSALYADWLEKEDKFKE